MKIWEILKEENIGRYVNISNQEDFLKKYYRKEYLIGKNGNGRIGIFNETEKGLKYVEEIMSTDILIMEFEFID